MEGAGAEAAAGHGGRDAEARAVLEALELCLVSFWVPTLAVPGVTRA